MIRRSIVASAVLCAAVFFPGLVDAQTPPSVATPAILQLGTTLPNEIPGTLGFGYSTAVDGDTIVAGAPLLAQRGIQRGGAAIYTRTGGTWALQQTLTRNDGLGLGGAVAISGDTLIVGRLSYAQGGVGTYVYVRNQGTWTLQDELISSGSSGSNAHQIAVDGNTALVAYESGAVYAFVRNGNDWTEQAKLKPETPSGQQTFPGGIALDGDTALIGAPGETVGTNVRQGAAYVFVRSGGVWAQQARLTASTGGMNGYFGQDLGLSGNTALIGPVEGYLFNRVGGTWGPQPSLALPPPRHPAYPDFEVASVALDGNTAIASMHEGGQGSTISYVYKKSGSQWIRLEPGTPALNRVALSANVVFAGDPYYGSDPNQNPFYSPGPGAAYVLAIPDGAPAAPTLSGSVNGPMVSLNWTPPTGNAATSYIIEAGTVSGADNLFNGNVGNILQIAASVGQGNYFLRVRGVNGFGAGNASNEVALTVGSSAISPPGPPSNLTANVTGTTVSFTWNPPSNGGPMGNYVLLAGLTPGFTVPYATAPLGTTPGFVVPNVPAGTYYARVLAQNAGGMSPASNEVSFTIAAPSAPVPPVMQSPVVNGSTVRLDWSGPAGASYTLLARATPNGQVIVSAPVGGITSLTVPGVGNGTYHVTAVATVGGQTSAESNQIVVVVQ